MTMFRLLRAALFALACLNASAASSALTIGPADPGPGYYQVAGVAAQDALNMRAEPDANAEIVGTLPPGARPVEVLEVRRIGAAAWGRVLADDANAWVSMRFLEPFEVTMIKGTQIPAGLVCGGTEPFWSAALGDDGLAFSTPDQEERVAGLTSTATAIGRNNRFAVLAAGKGERLTAVLAQNEQCSDGMSDRDFRWRVDLLMERAGDSDYPQLYEGCCRLPVSR